jgi:hypothetical protein
MDYNLLNIGFGGSIVAEEVIAILSPNSAPMKGSEMMPGSRTA